MPNTPHDPDDPGVPRPDPNRPPGKEVIHVPGARNENPSTPPTSPRRPPTKPPKLEGWWMPVWRYLEAKSKVWFARRPAKNGDENTAANNGETKTGAHNDGGKFRRRFGIGLIILALEFLLFLTFLLARCTAAPEVVYVEPSTPPFPPVGASVSPSSSPKCVDTDNYGLRMELRGPASDTTQLEALWGSGINTVVYGGEFAELDVMNAWIDRAYCGGLYVDVKLDAVYAHFAGDELGFKSYITELRNQNNNLRQWVVNMNNCPAEPTDRPESPGETCIRHLTTWIHAVSNKTVRVQIDFFNTDDIDVAVALSTRYLNPVYVNDYGDYTEIAFTPWVPDYIFGSPDLYAKVGVVTERTMRELSPRVDSSAVVQASDEGVGAPTPQQVLEATKALALSHVNQFTVFISPSATEPEIRNYAQAVSIGSG